jgi:hypothetical protein
MSKTVINKTHTPVRVPLPRGRVLHLGPNQTGHVSVHDADHPPLLKLVEAGSIELVDDVANEAIPEHGRRGESPIEE